ncbi:MAG: hypothetical protein Q9183_003829, partial [Haloplaca sp. 2 TL-2023]
MDNDSRMLSINNRQNRMEKESNQQSSDEQDAINIVGIQSGDIATETSVKAQELLNHGLRFLSTASNETLGACLVGLAAVTYVLLGRVGLVLMGMVAGFVLHATWEDKIAQPDEQGGPLELGKRQKGRREDEQAILHRVLNWRSLRHDHESNLNEGTEDAGIKSAAHGTLRFSGFQPATTEALTGLTDAVIRDYVRWWYGPLLPDDDSFPKACRQTFTGFLLSFSSHLARKRPADVFLDFLTNSSSVVIVFLNELANALTAASYSELESTDALHQYIEQNPGSNLANVLDVKEQRRKLKAISEDILQSFLEPKAYSCEQVRIFLRQILAGVCLEMTVQTCSKPEWINGWIVYLLEENEPELMNAIDVGIGATATNSSTVDPTVSEDKVSVAQHVNDPPASSEQSHHRRTVSRAEEAMDEAMLEAKRLSEMIATEEARKARENNDTVSSGTTTGGDPTPTSSHSDLGALPNSSLNLSGDSAQEAPSQQSTVPESAPSFTNFDQLLNKQPPTALQQGHSRTHSVMQPLTLHNASISIFDDAVSGDKSIIRSKPTVDYLLQVEPATSQHPGWMIARKYADFETLHEVLKRISVISGVPEFADRHTAIPGWKNRSKEALRLGLERYLRDALTFNRLAESEGMKRFLEKDQGLGRSSPNVKQGGFGFPTPAAFENMGKGMLDVLSAAPKGAAGGGKAILGGVSGVLGGVGSLGQKKQASIGNNKSAHSSSTALARADTNKPWTLSTQDDRVSQEVPRSSLSGYEGERTSNSGIRSDDENSRLASLDLSSNASTRPTTSKDPSGKPAPFVESSPPDGIDANSLHLPPPPSEIPDN